MAIPMTAQVFALSFRGLHEDGDHRHVRMEASSGVNADIWFKRWR